MYFSEIKMSTIKYESKITFEAEKESLRVEVTYKNIVTHGLETLVFLAKPGQPIYVGVHQLPLKAPYVLPKLVKDLQKHKGNLLADQTIRQIEEITNNYDQDSFWRNSSEERFPEEFKLGIIGGSIDELVLQKISEDEKKCKDFIGKADGTDLGHCVFLGVRHGKDFLKRAKFYLVSQETDAQLEQMREFQPNTIRIEFYGDKK